VAPVLRSAVIDSLFLDGSTLPGLAADRLDARGTVTLAGTRVTGSIVLSGARLGGVLDARGARLEPASGPALDGEDLDARAVLLRKARITGLTLLAGARLTADLDAEGVEMSQPDGIALNAGAIEVRGSVVFTGASIHGGVRLAGARISGDIEARDARFDHPGDTALHLAGAVVTGALVLLGNAGIRGALDLTAATIGTLHDDPRSWPGPGDLLLNRCLYQAFIDSPVDARSRLAWLALQDPRRWGDDVWPQPFEQLAAVFSSLGHDEDARTVLIAKERQQRRARRERTANPFVRAWLATMDGVLAVTVRYGRQPLLAFVWLLGFWVLGVIVFGHAERVAAIKPNSPVVLRSIEWTQCAEPRGSSRFLASQRLTLEGLADPGETQLGCFLRQVEGSSYPAFNPWMYAVETLFPVIEVDQKSYWRPDPTRPGGRLALAVYYVLSILGWALSLLAVAGFSGLVKSR
jgi:hypothetical protein